MAALRRPVTVLLDQRQGRGGTVGCWATSGRPNCATSGDAGNRVGEASRHGADMDHRDASSLVLAWHLLVGVAVTTTSSCPRQLSQSGKTRTPSAIWNPLP